MEIIDHDQSKNEREPVVAALVQSRSDAAQALSGSQRDLRQAQCARKI
jgi:hypothetical protein